MNKANGGIQTHTRRTVPLSSLRPAPYNPRRISDKALEGLAASLRQFGLVQEIVVNKRTGHVVGGHQRLKVLEASGVAKVPIVEVDLSEREEQALNVALNSPLISGEFTEDLGPLLDQIGADLPELFESLMLDDLRGEIVREAKAGLTDADEVPEPPKVAVTKPGDLWEMGEHRLLCGDALEARAVHALIGSEKVQSILADPPYGMDLDTDYSKMRSGLRFADEKGALGGKAYRTVIGDDAPFDPRPVIAAFSDPPDQLWFGADYYSSALPDTEHTGAWLVWDKRLDESADKMFGSCFELIWSKRKTKRDILRVKWAGLFGVEQEPEKRRFHPTTKPVALIAALLLKSGGTVADPFSGSGPTFLAAEQLERLCYGLEIDPIYCDVIVERWENFTGGKAKRKSA